MLYICWAYVIRSGNKFGPLSWSSWSWSWSSWSSWSWSWSWSSKIQKKLWKFIEIKKKNRKNCKKMRKLMQNCKKKIAKLQKKNCKIAKNFIFKISKITATKTTTSTTKIYNKKVTIKKNLSYKLLCNILLKFSDLLLAIPAIGFWLPCIFALIVSFPFH